MKSNFTSTRLCRWTSFNLAIGFGLLAQTALAQEGGQGTQAGGTAQAGTAQAGMDGADATSNADATDGPVQVEDKSDERPEPPGGTAVVDGEVQEPTVMKSAGMGSDTAYATAGVVELGGTVALDIRDELFRFSLAPTIGYFIADRLELTLIPILTINHIAPTGGGSQTNVRVAAVLEPSYHLPFTDSLYGFAGLGLGFQYEEGPGAAFLLRPVVGMDIMVGRSGILKPSGFVDLTFGDGAAGGGIQAGYTVMF